MGKLLSIVTGNPWVLLALFVAAAAIGGGAAWWVQGLRLVAVQAEYDGFVATTKADGEASKKLAAATVAEDRRIKESSDHEYETTIASLNADVKRLRDARSSISYVPPAPTGSRNPNVACFDRADLEQAIRRLDDGVSGIAAQGDTATVGLNVARSWADGIRLGNLATVSH